MYLLNPAKVKSFATSMKFTFHYVSIKSLSAYNPTSDMIRFTFHYVSIKSFSARFNKSSVSYLHSTMYLLNRRQEFEDFKKELNLHSTMYLLNQNQHYRQAIPKLYLHSTMYLLNQAVEKQNVMLDKFTFHYVSIKS